MGYCQYKLTPAQQKQLARRLMEFKDARVVCRFYDIPLIRELYPEPHWTWHHFEGRKQTNAAAPEVLLTNWNETRSLF